MSLGRGTVVLVDLGHSQGHEQQCTRPCGVVSDQGVLIAVGSFTGTSAQGALYPDLAPGASWLTKPSTSLVD